VISGRQAVVVTRPRDRDDGVMAILEAAGHRVHAVPAIAIEAAGADSELAAALAGAMAYDWIIVTSPTGARIVARLMPDVPRDPGARPHWAVVGPATAAAVEAAGFRVTAMPARARGLHVADAITAVEALAGRLVLLARADLAGSELPDALRAAGAVVDDLVAYRTLEAPPESIELLERALSDPDLGAIVVASGSAVRGLVRLAELIGPDAVERVRRTPLVSIGPATSGAACASGLSLAVESDQTSPDALAAAVLDVLRTVSGAYP
jgi:uroporphyrinogen-III synthase